jgi:hypothetical protein
MGSISESWISRVKRIVNHLWCSLVQWSYGHLVECKEFNVFYCGCRLCLLIVHVYTAVGRGIPNLESSWWVYYDSVVNNYYCVRRARDYCCVRSRMFRIFRVGIAQLVQWLANMLGYRLNGQELFLKCRGGLWGPQPPVHWVPGVKRLGREADHESGLKVKNTFCQLHRRSPICRRGALFNQTLGQLWAFAYVLNTQCLWNTTGSLNVSSSFLPDPRC